VSFAAAAAETSASEVRMAKTLVASLVRMVSLPLRSVHRKDFDAPQDKASIDACKGVQQALIDSSRIAPASSMTGGATAGLAIVTALRHLVSSYQQFMSGTGAGNVARLFVRLLHSDGHIP
jgi:hypothetical protein